MLYTVVFTPEAEAQLLELYGYIATKASPEVAARFTDGILTYCESLSTFPLRGIRREEVRPGLHITSYRKVSSSPLMWTQTALNIVGIFYGGQDYEAALVEDDAG